MAVSGVNYKAQNLFWAKVKGAPVLEDVGKLKVYAVVSGVGVLAVGGMVGSLVMLAYKEQEVSWVYYDGVGVLVACAIVNLVSLKRP